MEVHRENYSQLSVNLNTALNSAGKVSIREFLCWFIVGEPADINHFLILLEGVDCHRHVVISRNDLKWELGP